MHSSRPVFLFLIALTLPFTGCGNRTIERGYAGTPDELGQAIVYALNNKDLDTLHKLRVTQEEYVNTLWPAFPASNPKFNFTPEFAWGNLDKKCLLGVEKWAKRYGNQDLGYASIRFEKPHEQYEGFNLLRGTVLTVRTNDDKPVDLRILGSVVQKNGQYQLLSYED